MTEEAAAVSVAAAAAAAEAALAAQERCIKQPVQTVAKRQKYLSFHQVTDLFIAGNAIRSINPKDFR